MTEKSSTGRRPNLHADRDTVSRHRRVGPRGGRHGIPGTAGSRWVLDEHRTESVSLLDPPGEAQG